MDLSMQYILKLNLLLEIKDRRYLNQENETYAWFLYCNLMDITHTKVHCNPSTAKYNNY